MYCLISFLLLVNFSLVSAKVTSSPPVLIWGADTPKGTSVFRPVTSEQFNKIIKNLEKDNMIVMYLASELAAKDINCEACFPYISKIQPMNYYSQVEEPLEAVERFRGRTSRITWHHPVITDIRKLEVEMELPCEKGKIHAFSFNDRNVLAHDAAMAVATYQFSDCPVVHVYTAYTEEDQAYQRRKAYKSRPLSKTTEPSKNSGGASNGSDTGFHRGYSIIDNRTVLRHEIVVLSFREILMATMERRGRLTPVNRTEITLTYGREDIQVGFLNGHDMIDGVVFFLDTSIGPLLMEFVPSNGNWFFTRIVAGNSSHYPRDLIFFGYEFSLCCTDITVYALEAVRLTFFDFYLDIILEDTNSGKDEKYEVKPCWSCSTLMSPSLAQSIFVVLILVGILWSGMSMLLAIGQNSHLQKASDPDLHIKTDT